MFMSYFSVTGIFVLKRHYVVYAYVIDHISYIVFYEKNKMRMMIKIKSVRIVWS